MADFIKAFERTLNNEGGLKLSQVKNDRGKQTYGGISRRFHPNWHGWTFVDSGDLHNPALTGLVRKFFHEEFWQKFDGDKVSNQLVAECIYDFGVNAGVRTSIKIAQSIVKTIPDGIMGDVTLGELNKVDAGEFAAKFFIAKIARYAAICNKDKTQKDFLLGWVNRSLRGL